MDKIDLKILNELTLDSKQPLRQLAKKLNLSAVSIMNRIKKLEENNTIQNYTLNFSYDELGYDLHIMIEIRIAKGQILELEKKIAHSPNVYKVLDVTGDFDAIILARFKNRRTMDTFLKKIQKYDFIERINTRLVLNTIKNKNIELM